MAEEADVLIAWNHGAIPVSKVQSAFTRPTKFVNLPNPDKWSESLAPYGGSLRGILAKYAPGVTPLRVGLLGFSASCQGVAQALSSNDGGFIDSVVAVDGIHVGYSDKVKKVINPAGMKPWLDFGALAAVNERLFVDSYSSVVPPGYASTTETANWLWEKLTSSTDAYAADPPVPDVVVPPTSVTTSVNGPPRTVQYPAAPWKAKRRRGGLIMLGCSNLDPSGTTDHIYQGTRVLPVLLTAILAERWNAIDPKAPGASCFISGAPHPAELFMLGASCAHSVVLPSDYMQSSSSSQLPTAPATPAAPAASYSQAKGAGVGTLVAVGAIGLGAWWLFQNVLLMNPRRSQGMSPSDFDPAALRRGTRHEMEHTDSRRVAQRIAMDHLAEDPEYYAKLEAILPNPRALPYTVNFVGDTAVVRYKSADDPHRLFELRVKAYGTRGGAWDLYDPTGRLISRGTMGDFGSLNFARGPALPQTVDKAERVFRSTGVWGYTGPNKARWGVDQPG